MNFENSGRALDRALKAIPLAAQTLSRSHIRFPQEYPKFLRSGAGCRVVDVDGNEYIDLICGLGSVTLGYRYPAVDSAVEHQIKARGVGFSLPTELEAMLAEKLLSLTPWAGMVRFAKGGSDVMSAAVRLARAHTGRNVVLVAKGGYHGWHDWFVTTFGPPRNKGVDYYAGYGVREFTDAEDLFLNDQVAAVVVEPAHFSMYQLGRIAGEAMKAGALLVFDEVVSGFRFALGGYHMVQGFHPDLVAFGKGMGNGYPVSALLGRTNVMKHLDEGVFFTSTFGGDPIGLVAALATIEEIERRGAIAKMSEKGKVIWFGLQGMIKSLELEGNVKLGGHFAMSKVEIGNLYLRSIFLQEMARRGVLTYQTNTVCSALGDGEVNEVLKAYSEVLPILKRALEGEAGLLIGAPVQQAEVRR